MWALRLIAPIGSKIRMMNKNYDLVDYVDKTEGWLLVDENGEPDGDSLVLPDGYVEWNPQAQEWPATKTGIRAEFPFLRIPPDGHIITATRPHVQWEFADPVQEIEHFEMGIEAMDWITLRVEEVKKRGKK